MGELREVERRLVQGLQRHAFPAFFVAGESEGLSPALRSLSQQLGLFLAPDGLLRCRGRQANAARPPAENFPILLPKHSWITRLLILKEHILHCHASPETTLTQLRRKYWVSGGRQCVKSALRSCVKCRRATGAPFRWQPMPDLPASRIVPQPPFTHTGLDQFGPLFITDGKGYRKAYGLLFTCMLVRAVHLELMPSLSAESFLSALRRFIARRGCPSLILSDRAGAFLSAAMALGYMTTAEETKRADSEAALALLPGIRDYCNNNRIHWEFRPPGCPWQHGFYERLIQDIKASLLKVLWKQAVGMDEMATLLAEVEGLANCRPLTYNSTEADRWVLTPADFLLTPAAGLPSPPSDLASQRGGPKRLQEQFAGQMRLLDQFWIDWNSAYLQSLREKQQLSHKSPKGAIGGFPAINDVVLIGEDCPRGQWKYGRVQEHVPSKDGKVRTVLLRTETLKGLQKPINQLYPLEVNEEPDEEGDKAEPSQPVERTPPGRSCRGRRGSTLGGLAVTMMMLALLAANPALATPDAKCPEDATGLKGLQESHKCRSKGVVLFETKSGHLCYKLEDCGSGYLDGRGKCGIGAECECPPWAAGCSQFEGPPPPSDLSPAEVTAALEQAEPYVCMCSWGRHNLPYCSTEPSYGKFSQVQTLDGELHIVSELAVIVEEVNAGSDISASFTCYGSGTTSGTPEYCAQSQCQPFPTRLCYYKDNEIAFLKLPAGRLPIKAWGQVSKSFHSLKSVPPQTPTCTSCSVICVKNGVQVKVNEGMGLVAVCSGPQCFHVTQPQSTSTILFPGGLTMNDYTVTVKIYSNGYLVKNMDKACPSNPFCESIDCNVCLARIYNPHCAPKTALFAIFVMLYFGSVTLYVSVKLARTLVSASYYGAIGLAKCCQACSRFKARHRPAQHPHPDYAPLPPLPPDVERQEGREPRLRGQANPFYDVPLAVMMVMTLMSGALGCSEVVALTAGRSSCSVGPNQELRCVLSEATRLVLAPQGQDTCLLVKDPNGEPLGTLLVEVKDLALVCAKESSYFTRSFRMKTDSIKKCPWKGECWGERCGKVGPKERLADLSQEANAAPGFSGCMEACGCWGCGCFSCAAACQFYRVYAVPTSSTVYEMFTCPTWTYQVEVHLPHLDLSR